MWQDFLCDVTLITSARTNNLVEWKEHLETLRISYDLKLCSGLVHKLHMIDRAKELTRLFEVTERQCFGSKNV